MDLCRLKQIFASKIHLHDDRYYTETETDSLLSGKSDVGHEHDDRYYTETEVDDLLAGLGGGGGIYVAVIADEKTSGTNGGTFNSGSWQTRDLNTVKVNTITGFSMSANQFTLPAGDFIILAYAPAFAVHRHHARIQNITDGITEVEGESSHSHSTVTSHSVAVGQISIASPKIFE